MKSKENTFFKNGTEYYYQVEEFVTTFGADPGHNDSMGNTEIFKDSDLRKAQEQAIRFYLKRLIGLNEKRKYFLPFASSEKFSIGENAAMSVQLYLMEKQPFEPFADEYAVLGESAEDMEEGWEIEESLLGKCQSSWIIEGILKNEFFLKAKFKRTTANQYHTAH